MSFTETIAKRFMFIWLQSALFEGGTPVDRASRGLAEFFGLRAYPRNRIFEAADLWRPEIDKYLDIPTDPLELIATGGVSRETYRENNPETDARLWITGRVKSLKSGTASGIAYTLAQEHEINPEEIKAVKQFRDLQKRQAEFGVWLPLSAEQSRVRRLIKALLEAANGQ